MFHLLFLFWKFQVSLSIGKKERKTRNTVELHGRLSLEIFWGMMMKKLPHGEAKSHPVVFPVVNFRKGIFNIGWMGCVEKSVAKHVGRSRRCFFSKR